MAIYHKGQELSNPVREGKRINQIHHMGKKYLVKWLLSTTEAAIKLAFGSEAKHVISSTNAYLDTIASTDPQRAQQLRGFINEDPLLVCSLVETSKTRWLVGDNVAKISTDILATQSTKVEIEFILTSYSNTNATIIVAGSTWNNPQTTYGVFFHYSMKQFFNAGTGKGFGGIIELNALYNVKLNAMNNYCTINDGRVNGKTAFVGSVTDRGFVTKLHGKISFVDIDDHRLIPHLCPNGEAGMLDIISCTFYPNANTEGQFTIELTDK